MKTLGKLKINTERVLKNEELKNLFGGWSGNCEMFGDDCPYYVGPGYGDTCQSATDKCNEPLEALGLDCECRCCG